MHYSYRIKSTELFFYIRSQQVSQLISTDHLNWTEHRICSIHFSEVMQLQLCIRSSSFMCLFLKCAAFTVKDFISVCSCSFWKNSFSVATQAACAPCWRWHNRRIVDCCRRTATLLQNASWGALERRALSGRLFHISPSLSWPLVIRIWLMRYWCLLLWLLT